MEPAKANSGFNAPKFSRNCGLFVRLPSSDNGRLQLVLVKPVGTQVGTQIGGSHDGRTGLRQGNMPAAVTDWSVWLHPEFSQGFLWAPGNTSRTVGHLGFSSGSRFGSRELAGFLASARRNVSGFPPGAGQPV